MREFKNGNININVNDNVLDIDRSEPYAGYKMVAFILDEVDTYIASEPYCLGNSCGAVDFYNIRLDKMYRVTDLMIGDFMQGKTIKLIAYTPDDSEREMINSYMRTHYI